MRRNITLVAVAAGAAVVAAGVAGAGFAGAGVAGAGVAGAGGATSTHTYTAVLTRGAEVPRPSAPAAARGAFTAIVAQSGAARLLTWKLTFSGLTGKAIGAHVHRGAVGVAGGVLVPLCGPCRAGQTGRVKISKSVADALERGPVYVNVHTAKNAAGEVRGQLRLTGEDTSISSPGTTPAPPTTTAGGGGYDGY